MTNNLKANVWVALRNYSKDAKNTMSENDLIHHADVMYHLLQEVIKQEVSECIHSR